MINVLKKVFMIQTIKIVCVEYIIFLFIFLCCYFLISTDELKLPMLVMIDIFKLFNDIVYIIMIFQLLYY